MINKTPIILTVLFILLTASTPATAKSLPVVVSVVAEGLLGEGGVVGGRNLDECIMFGSQGYTGSAQGTGTYGYSYDDNITLGGHRYNIQAGLVVDVPCLLEELIGSG